MTRTPYSIDGSSTRHYGPENGYAGSLAVQAQDLAERAEQELAEPTSRKRRRRTAPTIEQAVDLAMAQPGYTIRVRQSWAARYSAELDRVSVYHYAARVLSVRIEPDCSNVEHNVELGLDAWGSVSDQGGVNRVLKHLGIPLTASRRGGGFTLESAR
jgi:hypothetical protein